MSSDNNSNQEVKGGEQQEEEPIQVIVKTTKAGDATNKPKKGQTVRIHYDAYLKSDGTKFDSSATRGHAFEFVLGAGQVIKGWEEFFPDLSLGQKVHVEVPPQLAYGRRGYPPIVPPNETLIYDIELISFSNLG
eukprot:g2508.t1